MMNNFYSQRPDIQHANPLYNQLVQKPYEDKRYEEIARAVKAVSDFCDSMKNIAPEYQNQAHIQCIAKIFEKLRE
ncbi:MAG: hypothetical protein IJ362_05620 [Oscillospiraceae bacterium]|nr:hypothetical protein [Oscillospiraceae bacterium]